MSLVATAARLDARIQNYKETADLGGLEQKAREIVANLSEKSNKLRQVRKLMECLSVGVDNSVDTERVRGHINHFQQQLAQVGLKAVQQPSASNLSESVRDFEENADRKGKSVWRNLFSGLTDDIQARVGRLGHERTDRNATSAHVKVVGARLAYPVDDWEKTEQVLGDDCSKWRKKIDALIEKLSDELRKAETAVAELPKAVQGFIAMAAANKGFALKDLTEELLAQLRDSGKVDNYTVRQIE